MSGFPWYEMSVEFVLNFSDFHISPLPAAANPRIFTITYTKGYHALLFGPTINLLKYSVIYQTDPYPCPFPSTHIDIF